MIGLGRMGANMSERLVRGGHRVVGYARTQESVQRVVQFGAEGVRSLAHLVEKPRPPRAIWLMLPAGDPVDQTLATLQPLVRVGDTIIDGGNSYYKHTMRRATMLTEHSIHYVDVGRSGGIW